MDKKDKEINLQEEQKQLANNVISTRGLVEKIINTISPEDMSASMLQALVSSLKLLDALLEKMVANQSKYIPQQDLSGQMMNGADPSNGDLPFPTNNLTRDKDGELILPDRQ